jgi:hypothetical protein
VTAGAAGRTAAGFAAYDLSVLKAGEYEGGVLAIDARLSDDARDADESAVRRVAEIPFELETVGRTRGARGALPVEICGQGATCVMDFFFFFFFIFFFFFFKKYKI